LWLSSFEAAKEMALEHGRSGHVVDIFRESTRLVARYGSHEACEAR
jgi:hypothetical protein